MSGAAIEFRNLTKRYKGEIALTNYNLTVAPGEFMTLLGPSGSGKTTALNALAGFIEPDSGDILVNGRSVLGLPPERRKLGMVFQGYTLFPHMNVYENVAFPLKLRKIDKTVIHQKVTNALEMVQLSSFSKRMPKELSGGQQQRVAFARAIVFEPPVLLMDEPLGALDLKLRQTMQLEIKHYHAELGCTIIFVTHDQEEALVLSDRVAVMGNGKIQQVDTPERIYDSPNSQYVAEFIGKTNIFSLRKNSVGGVEIVELGVCIPNDFLKIGDGAALNVRPEKIKRAENSLSNSIRFYAEVHEVIFLGNTIQYEMKLQSGAAFTFQEHRSNQSPPLSKGMRLELHFELEEGLFLNR